MEIATVPYRSILQGSNIMKPNYHLNYGKKRIERAIKNKRPFIVLGDAVKDVYTGGIFKRIFVDKEEYGLPYISAQHMMHSNPREVAKNISQKNTPRQNDMTLKATQILVSCAGTVGNVRLIGDDLEGIIGSQDIIRIIPDDSLIPYGYLYAYLSSPTAFNYIQSYIYGSVVPRIEPNTLAKLHVPRLSVSEQHDIHNLIEEASMLRAEANRLINKAENNFNILNEIVYEDYHLSVSENLKYSGFSFNINNSAKISIKAKNHSKRVLEIQKLWASKEGTKLKNYLTTDFRIGARGSFKRIDSDKVGVEMVSQSDLHRINPKNFKRVIVSRKSDGDYANDKQVLFPAVGNGSSESEILFRPTLAYRSFSNKLLSGDIGRLDCPSLEHAAYLFIALKSKGGFRLMRAFYYGTQLRRPLWELLKEINIPIKDENTFRQISSDVIKAFELRYEADIKEDTAISIIEKEIESWQK